MDEIDDRQETSITQLDQFLVVSLTDQMTDEIIRNVMETVLKKASHGIKGVILNYSMVDMIDSHAFLAFRNISIALDVMGVPSVWTNLKPGVVCSLLDINADFESFPIRTANNLNNGISLLKKEEKNKAQARI